MHFHTLIHIHVYTPQNQQKYAKINVSNCEKKTKLFVINVPVLNVEIMPLLL